MTKIRKPAVAGQFYSGTKNNLESQIENCFTHNHGPGKIPEVMDGPRNLIGLVSPHAGYPYSGPVAVHGYSKLAKDGKPETVIILGPNHSGMGAGVAFDDSEKWKTPFGEVGLDNNLRDEILSETQEGELDSTAHSREHSIEVQVPFLQYLFDNDFQIIPICLKKQNLQTSQSLGKAIGKTGFEKDLLVIGSTDLTHYEPQDKAEEKDKEVIGKMENLDWQGVLETVSSGNYSVCGYGPISATILASKKLGGDDGELYKYATSGDTGGPSNEVVGYCSLGISK